MKPNRKPKIYFSAGNATFYNEDLHGFTTKLVDDPKWQRPKIEVRNPEYNPEDPKWAKTLLVPDQDAKPNLVPDPAWVRPLKEIPNPDHNPDDKRSAATIFVPVKEAEHPVIENPEWQRPNKKVPNPDYDADAHLAAQTIQVPNQSIKPPKVEVPSSEHMIPKGAIEVTEQQFNTIQKQLQQADSQQSADDSGQPVVTVSLSLDEAKRRKRQEINRQRDIAVAGGVDFNNQRFDSDHRSIANINGAVTLAMLSAQSGKPYSVEWTLADNSSVTLDAQQMMALAATVGAHVDRCYQVARTHKKTLVALIKKGAAAPEITALDVTTGWSTKTGNSQ